MAPSPEGRAHRWLLVVAALVFVALRLPYISLPLERDEGEYAYVAWRMQAGELPYRDAFDQKPPGVFVTYLAAFALLGRSTQAIHALALVWSAASAACLYALMRRLAGGLAAACAVLVFAALGADPALGATAANTELFLLLPMLGSLLALVRGMQGEGAGAWLLCGALAATACWFKQVAATHVLFVAAAALLSAPRPRAGMQRLGWLVLGGLAVSLPVFAAFAAAGALDPFVDAVFLHNFAYAQRRSLGQGLDNLLYALGRQAPSLALVWALAAAALLRPRAVGRREWALLAGWLLSSAAGVAVGLQFRPHYFLQVLPALAALAGLGLAPLVRRALSTARGALVVAGLVLLVLAPPVLAQRELLRAGSPEAASRALYGLNPFAEAPELARYIARTSDPQESVLVMGSEPEILFHAERPSATRYIFLYPLTDGSPRASARQREAWEQVRASRPRYVVWAEVSTSLLASPQTDPFLFDAVRDMLRRDFRLELLLRTDPASESYETAHGREALSWLAQRRDAAVPLPWIALYRRVR